MRPLPLLATGLLAAMLLPAAPAVAAGETCQGRPATVVGTPLQVGLTGTEGDDVVVTNGAVTADTLGGNDLVCVTDSGTYAGVRLDTGAGDDQVDASGTRGRVEAILGAGADLYAGSIARDQVTTGPGHGTPDTEPDTVVSSSGGSATSEGDEVVSGTAGVPNPDDIRLTGLGSSVYWGGPMAAGARLEVGPSGTLAPRLGTGDVAIDAVAGTITEDGVVVLRWTGPFVRFTLSGTTAPRSLELTGSTRDEYVYTSFDEGDGPQRFDLGAGDDTLLSPDGMGGSGSRYVGGPGEDDIDLWAGKRLEVDLAARTWTSRAAAGRFAGWEAVRVGADRLELRGTKRADHLRFFACTATVSGRGGNDTLESYRTGDDGYLLSCDARRSDVTISGNDGRDTISGTRGKDLLVGGPGRDTVDGNANRDRCSGEKLKSCEIKLR
jgi:Ca2+-binding RTX toxin-like protein